MQSKVNQPKKPRQKTLHTMYYVLYIIYADGGKEGKEEQEQDDEEVEEKREKATWISTVVDKFPLVEHVSFVINLESSLQCLFAAPVPVFLNTCIQHVSTLSSLHFLVSSLQSPFSSLGSFNE